MLCVLGKSVDRCEKPPEKDAVSVFFHRRNGKLQRVEELKKTGRKRAEDKKMCTCGPGDSSCRGSLLRRVHLLAVSRVDLLT